MSKRKARPTVGAAEQAEKENMSRNSANSQIDYIMAELPEQGKLCVSDYLLEGKENALSSRYLCDALGIKYIRDLQAMVEQERRDGALILSSCKKGGGYFLPAAGEAGQREIADYVRTSQARALSILKTLKPARKALNRLVGQISLEGTEHEQEKSDISEKAL